MLNSKYHFKETLENSKILPVDYTIKICNNNKKDKNDIIDQLNYNIENENKKFEKMILKEKNKKHIINNKSFLSKEKSKEISFSRRLKKINNFKKSLCNEINKTKNSNLKKNISKSKIWENKQKKEIKLKNLRDEKNLRVQQIKQIKENILNEKKMNYTKNLNTMRNTKKKIEIKQNKSLLKKKDNIEKIKKEKNYNVNLKKKLLNYEKNVRNNKILRNRIKSIISKNKKVNKNVEKGNKMANEIILNVKEIKILNNKLNKIKKDVWTKSHISNNTSNLSITKSKIYSSNNYEKLTCRTFNKKFSEEINVKNINSNSGKKYKQFKKHVEVTIPEDNFEYSFEIK